MDYTRGTISVNLTEVEDLNVSFGYFDNGYGVIKMYADKDRKAKILGANDIIELYYLMTLLESEHISFYDIAERWDDIKEIIG